MSRTGKISAIALLLAVAGCDTHQPERPPPTRTYIERPEPPRPITYTQALHTITGTHTGLTWDMTDQVIKHDTLARSTTRPTVHLTAQPDQTYIRTDTGGCLHVHAQETLTIRDCRLNLPIVNQAPAAKTQFHRKIGRN